mmetsp:Transcript_103515/g.200560  ORF Transcript_103515/g.200560 Transcript_103515/m.200560 type:complete len:482 (+) Transcript_103515:68-1513(+)
MPVYEQKLVSPLALRFTQEHIRTTFRDGRVVEDSIKEITSLPGTAGYDVILRAPFPDIEIIRWEAPRHQHLSTDSPCLACQREKCDRCQHWFTLDNRRLYCLQRVALTLWPRRVAVAVDLLYADPGRIWKKYDSVTYGQTVSIGHTSKGPAVEHWDWQKRVKASASSSAHAVGSSLSDVQVAWRCIEKDDKKQKTDDLENAPQEEGSSLMALVHSDAPIEEALKSSIPAIGCVTPSTVASSEDSDFAEAELPPSPQELMLLAVKKGLSSQWRGGMGETYQFVFNKEKCWSCLRQDAVGCKTFTVFFDGYKGVIWWGTARAYFFNASEVAQQPDRLKMYAAGDSKKPRFVWKRLVNRAAEPNMEDQVALAKESGVKKSEHDGKTSEAGKTTGSMSVLEAEAIREIEVQLRAPSSTGYVWIPKWKDHFFQKLGSLRGFLERHPERFTVLPGSDRRYTVSLVNFTNGAAQSSSWQAPPSAPSRA